MFTQVAMRVVDLSRYEHHQDSKLYSYSSYASSQMMGSHTMHDHTHQEKQEQQQQQQQNEQSKPNVTLSNEDSSKKKGWCC